MKNKRKLIIVFVSLILTLCFLASNGIVAMAADMEGSGTEESPYLVRTIMDLYNIPKKPTAHYKLMNDLDLENVVRSPLNEFKGVFDGGGYTIQNLNVQGASYIGLFSKITNATIKNLTLKSPVIVASNESGGALCGYALSSTISNCYSFDGKITGSVYTGGLVGRSSSSNFYQCYVENKVSSSSPVGGLLGYSYDRDTIIQCITKCELEGNSYVGGILGYAGSSYIKLQDCYSFSNIKSTGSDNKSPSGLVSGGSPQIENCYAVTKIEGDSKVGLSSSSIITNSYFNSETLGISTPPFQARTTEQMYKESNYAGWDFETVWSLEEGKDYPKLKFEKDITGPVEPDNPDHPGDLQLKIVLEPEEQLKLALEAKIKETMDLTWTTSDPEIATVDSNGLVKAVKKGSATITAASSNHAYTESTTVLVVDDSEQYRMTVELNAGGKLRLTIDDAADIVGKWSVLDSSIATVAEKGRVTAVAEGLTIVTAKDNNENKVGEIYIRVK